jgi:nitrate/TMAO reductase-like tetraheme cytochrome c subunit
MRLAATFTIGAILALQCLTCNAEEVLRGRVVSGSQPVANAAVRIQGGNVAVSTDADGWFQLPVASGAQPVYVTAGKPGYYNGRRLVGPESVVIELKPVPAEDNPHYSWQDPTPNPAQKDNCGNCHDRIYQEWQRDKHSQASVNPLVLTMYNGTDVNGTAKTGPGYRIDWNDNGDCSTCHAPFAALGRRTDVDMNTLHGVERIGVSCDFCHKVSAIASQAESPDFADLKVLRPASGTKLLFGPFDDATFPQEIPDFAYSPLFKDSRLCAPCHDGRSWGVPTYETYSEWLKSSYATRHVQCQDCHMKSTGTEPLFANEDQGGKRRDPGRVGVHATMGAISQEFLRSAAEMRAQASVVDGVVTVRVEVKNSGAGHTLPSGQPMRNLILLISAQDSTGKPLQFVDGERVPPWGGAGGEPNDYAGRPGKGFAKVLVTMNEYQRFSFVSDLKKVTADFPAPFWRRNRIMSDNRILAGGKDESVYLFAAGKAAGDVSVLCTLLYRRAFKPLSDVKGWKIPDVVLAESSASVSVQPSQDAGPK